MSILVTGTGGCVGQSVLKCLQHTSHRVVAADGEVLGAGLYATGKGYVIPYANSPLFIERLLEICTREGILLLFPGLDAELLLLSEHRERFARVGTTVVVSEVDTVKICDDKLRTADFLRDRKFPFPKTWTLKDYPGDDVPFSLVIKPKQGGARSKDLRIVKNASDLARARADLDCAAFVAQELIEGPEYTCGTLTLDGRCQGAITLRRILRDGDTYKAFVERHEELEAFVTQVIDALKPFGPCNVQLRLRDGVPYIFEFNGRCSGTTYCRALAGFNEPQMIADFLIHQRAPSFTIKPLTILRYWNELVVENEVVEACQGSGTVNVRSGAL